MRQSARTANGRHPSTPLGIRAGLLAVLLLSACSFGGSATPTSSGTIAAGSVPSGIVPVTAVPPTVASTATIPPIASPAPATAIPSPTTRPAAPTPTPQAQAKPTPKGAQTLTLAGPDQLPPTLDPALIQDNQTAFIARQVFRGLVRLDDALNVVPDIAADYQKAADGRTYTFFLRSTAKFQNGRQITADDVAFSLKRACDPSTAPDGQPLNLPAAAGLNDIIGCVDRLNGRTNDVAGIQVLDPLTLSITLDAPKAYFLQKLTLSDGAVIDKNDLARGSRWSTQPNGSGPFKVAAWKPDEIDLAKNPAFYDQVPTLDTVTILVGSRAANQLNLYDANKLDVASVPENAVDRVTAPTSGDSGQLRVTPTLSVTYIGFNVKAAPVDAFNVRAALVRTIDRQKVTNVMFDGKSTEAKVIVPPAIPGGKWDATIPTVDVKTATDLVPPATAKGLTPIEFGSDGSRLGTMVKQVTEQNLGVSVDVEDLHYNDYLDELAARSFGMFAVTWIADYPDPENFLNTLFHTGSPRNYSGYSNPAVDALLDQANVEQDATKRADLYRQAQQQILNDVAVIPLYFSTDYSLVKPSVKGLTITAMGILRLETVWIEK
jgi:oligopeptide transport system substrate-binding protein